MHLASTRGVVDGRFANPEGIRFQQRLRMQYPPPHIHRGGRQNRRLLVGSWRDGKRPRQLFHGANFCKPRYEGVTEERLAENEDRQQDERDGKDDEAVSEFIDHRGHRDHGAQGLCKAELVTKGRFQMCEYASSNTNIY